MKLLSASDREVIETHLCRRLDEALAGDQLPALRAALKSYVLIGGGKRVRPQLVVWTWRHATGASPEAAVPAAVLDLAAGWELFHAFLLVHDDIIDGADHRRGLPSLHKELANLDHGCPRFGTNLGIVAGDLLFTAALQIWHEMDLPPTPYRDVLRLLSKIASITGYGQAVDILATQLPLEQVDEATLLREYHWKTAAYTFEGPMLSAAVVAGLAESARQSISDFSLAIGQAYQLHNDLLDLNQPAHEGCDLVEGKRTVALIRARGAMDAGRRERFDARFATLATANGSAVGLAEELRQELLATGVVERTRDLIDQLGRQAETSLANPQLPPSLRAGMAGLLGSFRAEYFAKV